MTTTTRKPNPVRRALPGGAKVLRDMHDGGGGRIGTIRVAPVQLRALLGNPTWRMKGPLDEDGDGKTDCEYDMQLGNEHVAAGTLFRVYAYKATSYYNPSLPTPRKFWKSEDVFDFSIGGDSNAAEVIDYLHNTLGLDAFLIGAR